MNVRHTTKMVGKMDNLIVEWDPGRQAYYITTDNEHYLSLTHVEAIRLRHILNFMVGDNSNADN